MIIAVNLIVHLYAEIVETWHWTPIDGEFDDYIVNPKPSGYQSLHTAVQGPDSSPLEFQIRTQRMHEYAEHGLAAHWLYKETVNKVSNRSSTDESEIDASSFLSKTTMEDQNATEIDFFQKYNMLKIGHPVLRVDGSHLLAAVVIRVEKDGRELLVAVSFGLEASEAVADRKYSFQKQRWEAYARCEGFEPEQPKLREMHLLCLKALEGICNGPAPHAMFQSLKILTIDGCELLQSLFASDVAQCLSQLQDLLVEDCPLLERVEAVNNEKTVLPKLKNLVLRKLPMLYGASGTTVDIEGPSLEHLVVVDCPKLPFSVSSDLLCSFGSSYQFSFSTSASDYFGSTSPVQLNDPQLYNFLRGWKLPFAGKNN
ncbi:hypothetical protein ACLB2K_021310 [Fragaria x ananassa]